jgi:hypothetical protein
MPEMIIFALSFYGKMNLKLIKANRRSVMIISVTIVLFVIVVFAGRALLLKKATASVANKMKRLHYTTHWDGVRFRGLRVLFFKGIYFQSDQGDDELYIDSVSIKARILPLMVKKVRIKSLNCKFISLRYSFRDSLNISDFSQNPDTSGTFSSIKNMDLSGSANSYLRRMFGYIPSEAGIKNMEARLAYQGNITVIGFQNLMLKDGNFSARIKLKGYDSSIEIPVSGKINKETSAIEVHMHNSGNQMLPLPLLKDKYGVSVGFDTLIFMCSTPDHSKHLVNVKGTFGFTGFLLNGERISGASIHIGYFTSSFSAHIGQHSLEIDSSSQVSLNGIKFNPYLLISLQDSPEVSFKILPADWDAGDFFASLPGGMFTSLTGLEATGTLHYFLNFSVDLNEPDSLVFDTRLRSTGFRVKKIGTDDYSQLNNSFTHRIIERGKTDTTFIVGPENPDYVPFEKISPFLRAAVMTSEDGSFYFHNGFNAKAFRESIATNLKEGRFARGGSTISMQLVKNVFLTRNKTIARKIEEALIVWLIESQNLVSKQRMYEVYLNIIEWGPGIYGIGRASKFYFNKTPGELNLSESIFLASIVPHPKLYKYSFEKNGITKPFYKIYASILAGLMVRHENITPPDTMDLNKGIVLNGPAAEAFITSDTTVADSILMDDLKLAPAF